MTIFHKISLIHLPLIAVILYYIVMKFSNYNEEFAALRKDEQGNLHSRKWGVIWVLFTLCFSMIVFGEWPNVKIWATVFLYSGFVFIIISLSIVEYLERQMYADYKQTRSNLLTASCLSVGSFVTSLILFYI